MDSVECSVCGGVGYQVCDLDDEDQPDGAMVAERLKHRNLTARVLFLTQQAWWLSFQHV